MFEKILITGASRGLGRAVALFLNVHLEKPHHLWVVARNQKALESLRPALADQSKTVSTEIHALDLSQPPHQENLCDLIRREKFDLVIHCAGGGPHGDFISKEWKDHHWALQLGLLAPMRIVLEWLKVRNPSDEGRFVIVGSRIAESSPDPQACAYATSKHGLMGFVSSLQPELEKNKNKVWLFSPGYMDSQMLPTGAKVRHDGSKLMSVETAAQALLRWVKKDGPWHRIIN